MTIGKFVHASKDGIIDITYTENNGDVKRIASHEAPAEELKEAAKELVKQIEILFSMEVVRLRSVDFTRDDIGKLGLKFQFEVSGGHLGALKVTSPKIEYHVDPEGLIQFPERIPLRLIEASREFELCLERYVRGERAQRVFEFTREESVTV